MLYDPGVAPIIPRGPGLYNPQNKRDVEPDTTFATDFVQKPEIGSVPGRWIHGDAHTEEPPSLVFTHLLRTGVPC